MIYIGTAAWAIASRYQDVLPGEGSHLQRYARQLNAVEINSSFKSHHRQATYARWAASVPPRFRFSVKVPKALTHASEPGSLSTEVLDRFVDEVSGLGSKLGVLLVQFPPKLAFDASLVGQFFDSFRRRIDVPLACEPRHPTWNSPLAESVLTDCAVARVAADPPPWPGGDEPSGYGKLAYFRWHGQPRKYYSDYDEEQLASLQRRMALAGKRASNVWAILDNTAHGHALGNALTLQANAARRAK